MRRLTVLVALATLLLVSGGLWVSTNNMAIRTHPALDPGAFDAIEAIERGPTDESAAPAQCTAPTTPPTDRVIGTSEIDAGVVDLMEAMDASQPETATGDVTTDAVIDASTRLVLDAAQSTPDVPAPAIGPAHATETAVRVASATATDPDHGDSFGPITSPDVGTYCANGLDAADITAFFAGPIGELQGADYQRTVRLDDDRVLWTFQDAFVAGHMLSNFGIIQSGRCFTLLDAGTDAWLLHELTSPLLRWHWILGGGVDHSGDEVHLYVVEMVETGASYLDQARPTALRRVVLDSLSLEVLAVFDEPQTGTDLYGWSVTEDAAYTYLYSHCFQQFGYDTILGFGPCAEDVKLARIPAGQFAFAREYWNGADWTPDPTAAAPVIDAGFMGAGNNPAQIRFDGDRFLVVEKPDDWWGGTIGFAWADHPQGPFTIVAMAEQPVRCDWQVCTTYFASWIPWHDSSGHHIWSVGHNLWNGTETAHHLDIYGPTFHTCPEGV